MYLANIVVLVFCLFDFFFFFFFCFLREHFLNYLIYQLSFTSSFEPFYKFTTNDESLEIILKIHSR